MSFADIVALLDLVKSMRAAQKRFHTDKRADTLLECKRLEGRRPRNPTAR